MSQGSRAAAPTTVPDPRRSATPVSWEEMAIGRIRPSTAGTRLEQLPMSLTALSPCPSGHSHQRPDTEPAAARERLLLLAEGTAQ